MIYLLSTNRIVRELVKELYKEAKDQKTADGREIDITKGRSSIPTVLDVTGYKFYKRSQLENQAKVTQNVAMRLKNDDPKLSKNTVES